MNDKTRKKNGKAEVRGAGLSVKEESYRMAKLLRSGMRELDRQLNIKRARRPR